MSAETMKSFLLPKNSLNVQKLLLPDCQFLQEYYGRHCFLPSPVDSMAIFIVKIGLCEVKNVKNALFFDDSVSLNPSLWEGGRVKHSGDVVLSRIRILKNPLIAKKVKVKVFFSDSSRVLKYNKRLTELKTVVKDILKIFTFCENSSLSLENFKESQKFGVFKVEILKIEDSLYEQLYEVDSSTEVEVESCTCPSKFTSWNFRKNLIEIGGCSRAYKILKKAIQPDNFSSPKVKSSKKILLIGPSGCGKTTLVYNVVNKCNCFLYEIGYRDFYSSRANEIFREATYQDAEKQSVILIRNIDEFFVRKISSKRCLEIFYNFLDNLDSATGIAIVATTNSLENINNELRKHGRFEDEIEIMVPTAEEREDILCKLLNHEKIVCENSLVKKLSKWTPGFVGGDLRLLVAEAWKIMSKMQSTHQILSTSVLQNCFEEALTKVIPSALRGTDGLCPRNDESLSKIGGLDEVIKTLYLAVIRPLENPNPFRRLGVPLTKGILLYGPPGCGKTTLVKALANECRCNLIVTSAADLYSPYVGEAEQRIVKLFARAREVSPAILFIDEIDAVVGSKSGDRESGVQERVLSTLLIEMDGVGVKVNTPRDNHLNLPAGADKTPAHQDRIIVIGATNRPQSLDGALKRPGRFDKLIRVPPPDAVERLRILRKATRCMPLEESVDLEALAEATNFYSGADLINLCNQSGLCALKSTEMTGETCQAIGQAHFDQVLREYKPSLNEKIVSSYEAFRQFNE